MLTIGDFARLGRVSPRMLRHYDDLGLLRPDQVDPVSGYRFYAVAQLTRLHRLVALRDLGFGLDEIGELLDDDLPLEQLRGMLRMRRSQIQQTVAEEQARLRRVEARLRAIEGSNAMQTQDVVLKQTQPLRIAEASGTAPGFGSENLAPVFGRLFPKVFAQLDKAGIAPGVMVAYYEQPDDEGTVVVHAGFEVGNKKVPRTGDVSVVELPVIEVASVVHRGSMDDVEPVYESLVRWIEDSGLRLAGRSRELYLQCHEEDPSANVTELQMPIAR
jgi:DNA-binding transcriptional MerR regulator/predicted transcriptional regulator YdeE